MLKVELQSKKQSLWSTFKKAYLRSKNLKKIWKNLDKSNLSKDLVKTFDLYLNSESYNWSSKMWRHSITNHINALSDKPNKDTNWMIWNYFGARKFIFGYFFAIPFFIKFFLFNFLKNEIQVKNGMAKQEQKKFRDPK